MTNNETRRRDDPRPDQKLEWDSDKKLVAAALLHLELERAAAALVPVPETEPRLYVAVGTAAEIARMLPQNDSGTPGVPAEQQSINTPEFHALVLRVCEAEAVFSATAATPNGYATFEEASEARKALIAHIDTHVNAQLARQQSAPAEHRAVIEEAAQVLESAAAHNRSKGRTVLERTQQDRADRLRAILAEPKDAQ